MTKKTGNSIQETVVDSSVDFFDKLERGIEPQMTADKPPLVEQKAAQKPKVAAKEQVTPKKDSNSVDWDSKDNPYLKRYQDSSREAVRLKDINDENQQYSSLINVMKTDPTAKELMTDYLKTGGKPSKMSPKVSEDFVFDPDEALQNPDSESSRVFGEVVRNIVKEETTQVRQENAQALQGLQKQREQDQLTQEQHDNATAWRQSKGMSEDEFVDMMGKAEHINFDYDLINDLVNREKATEKIADDQRNRVRGQMERASVVPESLAAKNSAPSEPMSPEQTIHLALKEIDSAGLEENLFE